jgi:hypothetical protein
MATGASLLSIIIIASTRHNAHAKRPISSGDNLHGRIEFSVPLLPAPQIRMNVRKMGPAATNAAGLFSADCLSGLECGDRMLEQWAG